MQTKGPIITQSGRWHQCVRCHRPFEVRNYSQKKYCSRKCARVGFRANYHTDAYKNKPTCKVCGGKIAVASKAHNLSCQICKKKFCNLSGSGVSHNPKTCSPECVRKLIARKLQGNSGSPRLVWPKCKLCHQPHRPSAKSKAHNRKCTICRREFCDPNYGTTCSTRCAKEALVRVGKRATKARKAARKSLEHLHKKCSICHKLKIASGHSRYHNRTCEHCQKPFCSYAIKQVYCSQRCRYESEKTSIERWVETQLRRLRVPFETQWKWSAEHRGRKIWGRADFLVGSSLVIFADGTYWHRDEVTKARDRMQSKALAKLGYDVLRLREAQIKSNPAAILAKMKSVITEINTRTHQCLH